MCNEQGCSHLLLYVGDLYGGELKGVLQEGACAQGTAIKSGTPIRLQHMNTRRWLHSHKFPSPLSGNQEVRSVGMRLLVMGHPTSQWLLPHPDMHVLA